MDIPLCPIWWPFRPIPPRPILLDSRLLLTLPVLKQGAMLG